MLPDVPQPAMRRIRNLVLDVKDSEYFGYFNMQFIMAMSALERLDLLAARGVVYAWSSGNRHIEALLRDIEEAREEFQTWSCPRVRIFNKHTMEEVGGLEGGPKDPNWTSPSPE